MNRRKYNEGHKRQDVLNMQSGQRTIIVVSLNPDNFASQETKIAITKMLQKGNTHRSTTRNTHTT